MVVEREQSMVRLRRQEVDAVEVDARLHKPFDHRAIRLGGLDVVQQHARLGVARVDAGDDARVE